MVVDEHKMSEIREDIRSDMYTTSIQMPTSNLFFEYHEPFDLFYLEHPPVARQFSKRANYASHTLFPSQEAS